MWQKAKDEPPASHSDNTPDTEVSQSLQTNVFRGHVYKQFKAFFF